MQQFPFQPGNLRPVAVGIPGKRFDPLNNRLNVRLEVEELALHDVKCSERASGKSRTNARVENDVRN